MALREIAAGEVDISILEEPDLPPISTSMETPQPAEPTEEELEAEGEKKKTKPAGDADAEK